MSIKKRPVVKDPKMHKAFVFLTSVQLVELSQRRDAGTRKVALILFPLHSLYINNMFLEWLKH